MGYVGFHTPTRRGVSFYGVYSADISWDRGKTTPKTPLTHGEHGVPTAKSTEPGAATDGAGPNDRAATGNVAEKAGG